MSPSSLATRFVSVLLVLALTRTARADPPAPLPVVAVPPGDDVIVAIRKGDPAPFTGQLFDEKSALRWANYLQQYKYRLAADVAFQKQYDQATIDYLKKSLEDANKTAATSTQSLQLQLATAQDAAQNPPFYKTFWFGVVIGFVIAGGAVCLAAVGLSAVGK